MLLFLEGIKESPAELTLFIIGLCLTALTIAGICLSFKAIAGRVFKLISLIILPVLTLTAWFGLLFVGVNAFAGSVVLAVVIGFGIAAALELVVFAISYFANRGKEE